MTMCNHAVPVFGCENCIERSKPKNDCDNCVDGICIDCDPDLK